MKISERLESWRESSSHNQRGGKVKEEKGATSTKCAEQLKREQIKALKRHEKKSETPLSKLSI